MLASFRTLGIYLSLSACLLGGTARAQVQVQDKPLEISIPAGNLADALEKLGSQAGLQIMYEPEVARGISVAAVNGTLTADQALTRLLATTGLKADRVNDKTVVLRKAETGKKPQPAKADQNSPSTANQSTQESSEKLEEIVVTAQKREERLQNVPISISVLTGTQLENPEYSSAADALSTVPGVAINQSYITGGTQVTIRGVSVAAPVYAGSSPVAYYLDALPFGFVKSAIAPDQDVYDLQRIEVLKGPQGTLYGASALNGVVRIITNDVDLNNFDFKARGSGSYTDDGGNNYRGDMAVNVPIIDGKLAARAVVGYEDDSGFIDTPIEKGFNDSLLKNFRAKIDGQLTDDFKIGLSYWGARDDFGGPSTGSDDYKNSSVQNQAISSNFDAYDLKLSYSPSGYSVSNTTSYLTYGNNSGFDFTSLLAVPFVLGTELNSDVVSDEFLVNSQGNGPWRWSVGAMYRHATEDRFTYNSLSGPMTGFILSQDTTSSSYAAYGEVTRLLLGGRLEATVGLRWFEDHQTQDGMTSPTGASLHDQATFVKTTPRAVLAWHENSNLTMYGSFSEGFRSGVLQDFGVLVPPATADTLYNYELGAKGTLWGGLVDFDSAIYYIDWKDVQQSLDVPYGTIYTGAVVNGQSASGPGVDLSLAIHPVTGLTLGVAASWNKLEMDKDVYSSGVVFFPKGSRLNSSPETTASGSGAYAFPLGSSGWTGRLSASVTYTSAQLYRVNPGGPIVLLGGGDPIVIGRVGMSVESREHWIVTLFGNNINNERKAIVRPFDNPDLTSRIRPLTAGLQVEYHYK